MNVGRFAPGSGTVQKNAYGPGATGRPAGKTTRPKPMFAPTSNADMMPEYLKTANDLMKTYGSNSLPSGLKPRWQRNKINANISKGMTKGK
jgi:hypothetical protein